MEKRKVVAHCSKCKKPIYDTQVYIEDRRISGKYCSSDCCNQAVDDEGYSWESYSTWKD